MEMDESELQHNIELYKNQLIQVEEVAAVAGQTEELTTLISDLKELITLTEGSLLSLKKSHLLKSLEDAQCSPSQSSLQTASTLPLPLVSQQKAAVMDHEYLAFKRALIAEEEEQMSDKDSVQVESSSPSPFLCVTGSGLCSGKGSHRESDPSSTDSSDSEGDSIEPKGHVQNLVGMKCRAPFSHAWGKLDYHNAMVMSATRQAASDSILVTVMFITPTHNSMKPCKFYLDGYCRFSQEMCKYSHGHTVLLEELRPFVEADHSVVAVGRCCLACYTDGIWYPATVTELKGEVVSVHLDQHGEDMDLDISQIVPLASHAYGNDSSDEDCLPSKLCTAAGQGRTFTCPVDKRDEPEDEEVLPLFLWKPPQTTSAMGDWEAHTRGIGSRLMMKMGYVPGQGLGVEGQGKAEPIPIMLLPQGKSLDHIMELKALAGNQDLFNAMKRLEKQQKKADKMREQTAARETKPENQAESPTDVFDFINRKLREQEASLSGSAAGASTSSGADKTQSRSANAISEHQLHSKSDRDVNVQVLRTEEEIRSVERQLDILRRQLVRLENRDRKMAARVREKVAEREAYLGKLKDSSQVLERHQACRKHGKKLEVF